MEDVALLYGALGLFATLEYDFQGASKHSIQSKVLVVPV